MFLHGAPLNTLFVALGHISVNKTAQAWRGCRCCSCSAHRRPRPSLAPHRRPDLGCVRRRHRTAVGICRRLRWRSTAAALTCVSPAARSSSSRARQRWCLSLWGPQILALLQQSLPRRLMLLPRSRLMYSRSLCRSPSPAPVSLRSRAVSSARLPCLAGHRRRKRQGVQQ